MFRRESKLTFFAVFIIAISAVLSGCGGSEQCVRPAPILAGVETGPFLAVRVSHEAIWKRAQSTWKNGLAQKGAESYVVSVASWEPGDCDHCVILWLEAIGSGGTKESLQVRGQYVLLPLASGALVRFVPTAVELAGQPEEHVLTEAAILWVREQAAQPLVEIRVPVAGKPYPFEVNSVMDAEALLVSAKSPEVRGGATVGSASNLEVAVSQGLRELLVQREVAPDGRVVVDPWVWRDDAVRVNWQAFDAQCKSTRGEWEAARRADGALEVPEGDPGISRVVLSMRPESVLGIPEGQYHRGDESWIGEASVDPQREALSSLYGEFMRCYGAARATQERVAGVVELEWTIDAAGRAADAVVTYQEVESPELLECIIQTVLDAKFAPATPEQRLRRRFEFQGPEGAQGN